MSDRRPFRWATTSARLIAGTVVSAGFVIAVVTAASVPWPAHEREPVSVEALPAPSDTVLVCDGGLLALGRASDDADQLVTVAAQTVVDGTAGNSPAPVRENLAALSLDDGSDGPVVVVAQPENDSRTDAAASGFAAVADDDLNGFAAAACRSPLLESWLVGGSTTTGAADLVVLANPSDVAATVQLTVFGAGGAQTPPGGSDVVVPAGAQLVVPLAGLVIGEGSPVVRVTATGAPVRASLQASQTRTLVPIGVDQVSPIAAPALTQIIPGVAVTIEPGAEGASDATTLLRVLAPAADATATVTVTRVGASPAVEPISIPLTAAIPTVIDLGGLQVGEYVVEVTADAPVVAAAWQATGFVEGSDFAWYAAAPEISVPSLFAVPPSAAASAPAVLTLVNPSDEPVTVALRDVVGAFSTEITVAPHSSAAERVGSRTVYLLDPGGSGIRAGLSFAGAGALAGFPVWPADAAAQGIAVYP